MRSALISISFILILVFYLTSAGETYWVDAGNQSPPYLGTRQHPWPHPGYACHPDYHRLSPGDTINVLPGVYLVNPRNRLSKIHIRVNNSNPHSAPVVFRGYEFHNDDKVFIRVKSYESEHGIFIDHRSHNVVIEDFYISNAFQPGRDLAHPAGVKVQGSGCIVRYNHIYGCHIGIFASSYNMHNPSLKLQIYGNVISQSGEAGIRIKGAQHCKIYSNLLYNNGERDEPAASITIYRTTGTQIYNNTIITYNAAAIELYRGTNSHAEPCRRCEIFDNICVKLRGGDNPIFSVHYTMKRIESNKYHHNTWYNPERDCLFNFGGWTHHTELQRFNDYIRALPRNGVNGRGEVVRDPELESNFFLDIHSPEVNDGSRPSAEANLNRATTFAIQAPDIGLVDRGYHQLPYRHSLNPPWYLPPPEEPVFDDGSDEAGISLIVENEPIQQAFLYNILGQKVAVLTSDRLSAVRNEINNRHLANGLYILNLKTASANQSLKIIINR